MRVHLTMTFFLSAHHWVVINNVKGKPHTHMWELALKIGGETFENPDLEIGFAEVDKIVREYLSSFEGKLLNDFKPFHQINPSTENLGLFFSQGLMKRLSASEFHLEELLIKESPTKGFLITDLNAQVSEEIPPVFSGEPELAHLKSESIKPSRGATAVGVNGNAVDEITAGEVAAAAELLGESDAGPKNTPAAKKWHLLASLFIVFILNGVLYSPVLFSSSPFPWGSDTWGHLFKTEFLINSIQNGNIFPHYLAGWYNGIDPFRYYAPMSYYVLSFITYFTGDVFKAANLFLFLIGFTGSAFWLVFHKRLGLGAALTLAVMWSVVPDNLRVAFSEGNLPRVMAAVFLPLLIYFVVEILDSPRSETTKVLGLVISLNLVIISHAMVGALFLTGLTIYSFFVLILGGTDIKRFAKTLFLFVISFMISGWWLLPSLSGGITSIGNDSSSLSVGYFLLFTLNPFLRLL